ncbi:hypothetical protein [Pseudovibrio exalbescens]|uniref:hypothetical protein n=1 Tax=Pseudovibrio exalbescens TaxID=197461 RepID=UPI000C9B79D0|nr:hypothetical protein [Pseudovibrio exalbescens]
MPTFHFTTDEPLQTTEATMAYWVENFMSSRCEILLNDGSYMEIKTPNGKIWEAHARGAGDFTSHVIEFKEVKV